MRQTLTQDPLRVLRLALGSISRIGLLGLGCLSFAALICPFLLDWWELFQRDAGVTYEGTLRVCLGLSLGLALLGSRLFCWPRWSPFGRLAWHAVLVASLVLVIIFTFDWATRLDQEDSWIRYPTAIALLLAAGGSLRLAQKAKNKTQRLIWLTLCSGFLLGGADELLEIHEAIARLTQFAEHGRSYNDLLTLAYAVIGAGVLVALLLAGNRNRFFKAGWRSFGSGNLPLVLTRYLAAMIVFAISQVLDTFDIFAERGLQILERNLVERGHTLPEFWLLSRPRQFMNSLEEVLECLAAVLILAITFHALRGLSAGASSTSTGRSARRPDDGSDIRRLVLDSTNAVVGREGAQRTRE